MKYQRFLRGLTAAIFGCILIFGSTSEADAFFGRFWRNSFGSSGGHGSGGSHGGYSHSSYGSHGSSGSHGSYGSHGSNSAPGGYSYHWGSGYVASTELSEDEGEVTGLAKLHVSVPAGAQVMLNGRPTASTGTDRLYIPYGLMPGEQYRYEIRVQGTRDGEELDQTKIVMVRAGEQSRLTFAFDDTDEISATREPVQTRLTVKLPADAKLKLVGTETLLSGPVRTFSTTNLEAGEAWRDYHVEVTLEHDGRLLTRKKTITLHGGESVTLSFDLDAPEFSEGRDLVSR